MLTNLLKSQRNTLNRGLLTQNNRAFAGYASRAFGQARVSSRTPLPNFKLSKYSPLISLLFTASSELISEPPTLAWP